MAQSKSSSKSVLPQVMLFFGITMFVVYVAVGVALISLGHIILPQMPHTYRILMGAMVIAYALFRLFRVVKLFRNRENL